MKGSDLPRLAACAAFCAILLLPLRSAVVDDTYIHLQYARNLAEAGELSFNRGDPTYGATSPLWVALLAAVHRAGGDLLFWCRALAWIAGIAIIALLYLLVLRISGRRDAALAAAILIACEAWLLRWTAVGMETPFCAFMVLLVLAISRSAMRSYAHSLLFGLALFAAVLSRPEAMLLVPLALVACALSGGGRYGVRFAWFALFAALFAVWLFAIKHHTGTYLPLTAGAKQGRPVLSAALFARSLVPIKIMGATLAVPWIVLLASLFAGLVRGRSRLFLFDSSRGMGDPRSGRPGFGMLLCLLWVFALPAAYVLFDFQVLSRYLVPVSPAVVLLGVVGGTALLDGSRLRPAVRSAVLAAAVSVAVIQNVVVYAIVVVPPTREFARGIEDVIVPMGRWLERNSAETAVVAAPDIGAIGYTSRRRVLDLGGLVTPEINRMRRTIDVERIIEEGRYLDLDPDFLVDRSAAPARFDGAVIRGVAFTEVLRGTVANLGIRKPEPVVYVLYRLRPGSGGGGDR